MVFNVIFRLAAPEDVQYFKFDQQGNMFVYAPGAGFSGKCELVRPGDELKMHSSTNNSFKVDLSQGMHSALSTQRSDVKFEENVTQMPLRLILLICFSSNILGLVEITRVRNFFGFVHVDLSFGIVVDGNITNLWKNLL